MLTDTEIEFLRARLDEDEAMARRSLDAPEGTCRFVDADRYSESLVSRFADEDCVLREVAVWRRLLLDYQTAPLDAAYGGTERETGFRLALSAALKAKIATYDGNPVTGEPFPVVRG